MTVHVRLGRLARNVIPAPLCCQDRGFGVLECAPALVAVKTSDAVSVSSGEGGCVRLGCREGGRLVVGLAGVEAVVQAAEEACVEVALGGGVPVSGLSAAVEWARAPGEAVSVENAQV
jgi:hypothetical protein